MNDADDAPGGANQFALTAKALRRQNRELAALGWRICTAHQGAPLPLTAEYFYPHPACLGGLETICKACRKARTVRRARERYQTDADYRQRRKQAQRLDRKRHRAARLARQRRYMRTYRQRRKQARFTAVLVRTEARALAHTEAKGITHVAKWANSRTYVKPRADPYDAPVGGLSRDVWDALECLYFLSPAHAATLSASAGTMEKLAARGYVEVRADGKFAGRYVITAAGEDAVTRHWAELD